MISTILAGTTGCALVDPYRQPLTNSDHTIKVSKIDEDPATDAAALSDARKLAQAMADSYRAAAVDHSRAKTGLALGLIGLNTLALFKASTSNVANDGSDLLPAVGFGSAGALNAGSLLISSPRQALYLMGRETVLCAKAKTDPFIVPSTDEFYLAAIGQESEGRSNLPKALLATTKARDSAAAQLQATAGKPDLAAARSKLQASLQTAETKIGEAAKTLADADDAANRRRQAALKLRTDVGMISAAIDRQVQRTEPDVDAIRRALSNSALASIRDLGAPAPAATPPAKDPGATGADAGKGPPALVDTSQIDEAVMALDTATERLETATANTARVVARMSKPANATESACVVAGLVTVSIVKPAASLAASGQLQISVFTMGPAPIVQIDGDGTGLTHEVISTGAGVGGFQVRVKADATAKPGVRTLIARSADGIDLQTTTFEVAAASQSSTAAPGDPAWLTDFPDAKAILADGQAAAKNDYNVALAAYAQAHELKTVWTDDSHKKLTDEVKAAMKAAKMIAGDKPSNYELWWADDKRIRALQKALKVTETAKLDTETRAKLKSEKGSEQLTAEIAKAYGVG